MKLLVVVGDSRHGHKFCDAYCRMLKPNPLSTTLPPICVLNHETLLHEYADNSAQFLRTGYCFDCEVKDEVPHPA